MQSPTTTTHCSPTPRTAYISSSSFHRLFPSLSSTQRPTMRGSGTILTSESSSTWQRRTNRIIAAGIIVVGLTMMISQITQCIYIGMLFIIIALIWLAWLTMKERKLEPPRPEDQPSPVLFLVTSQMLPRVDRPSVPLAGDKPPSYDTIVTLDGLPPDYSTVLAETPPSYEELAALYALAGDAPRPSTSGFCQRSCDSMDTTSNGAEHHKNNNSIDKMLGSGSGISSDNGSSNKEGTSIEVGGVRGGCCGSAGQVADTNESDDCDCGDGSGCVGKIYKRASNSSSNGCSSSSSSRRVATATSPEPAKRQRRRTRSSSARTGDTPGLHVSQQQQEQQSPTKSIQLQQSPSRSSLLKLQVPTLSRDTAGSRRGYLGRPEPEDVTVATDSSGGSSSSNLSSNSVTGSYRNSAASSNYSVEASVAATATNTSINRPEAAAATVDSRRGLRFLATMSSNVTPVPSRRVHRHLQLSNNTTLL